MDHSMANDEIENAFAIRANSIGNNHVGIELKPLDELYEEIISDKPRSTLRMFLVLAGLNLSLFIAALDYTIVATAVPTITADLKSSAGYVWIGGAYLLANAAAGPIWAKLSDIWGRKLILLAAVAMFLGSSILCARASSMKMLIAGRALQGTAGGGLIQLVMITISDLFSMRNRSLYLGLTEVMWALAGGVGPILGGAFTEKLSWRWCFWINLPISGITFLLLFFFLDVYNPKTAIVEGLKAIDWFGCITILALTLMLLLGLEFGGATFPWNSPQVICLVVFGSLMSIFFIYGEKRLAKYPLMPLGIFKRKSNVASLAVCFFQGMVIIVADYYLPLYFQSVMEASPLRSGILVLPITVTEALMGIAVGVIIHRTGRYLEIIYIGTALMAICNGLYILFGTSTSIGEIVAFQIIGGLGAGMLFEAPLISLQALCSQDDTATATATFSFVRNLATSLSVVIAGVVFQNSMNIQVEKLSAPPLNLPSNITELLSDGAAAANVKFIATVENPVQKLAIKEAFAMSMRNMWILTTCLSVLSVIAGVFVGRHHLSNEHVETKTGIKREKQGAAIENNPR